MTAPAASPPARDPSGYTARHLSVLEGLEAVRKRPGMYIGSTDGKGLTHLAYEIIDNAVDEALAGHCTRIEVTLHPDGSLEVADNGRGIPVDVEPRSGLTGVELVLTKLHAGGKFGGGGYKTSGGLHGVGASVVNALSQRLDVVVRRGGRAHTMSFSRGVPGVFAGAGPGAAFTARDGLSVAGRTAKASTGTTVRWWADTALFSRRSEVDVEQLTARLRQTAFLVPGLTLVLLDRRDGDLREEVFAYAGGTVDFVTHLAPDHPVCDPVHLTGTGSYKETVPVLDDKGHLVTQTVERQCEVDVALRWGTGYETTLLSFCNVVATAHGGTHQNGFERALLKAVNEALVATRVHKAKDDPVIKDDVLEGLTAVVTVKVPEPQYLGQTKDELGTSGVTRIVADVVGRQLKAAFLDNRRTRAAAKQVLEKVAAAARTRQAARASKDAARRKTALETSTLPAKLADCRSTDVSRTELWLVEGDSALGTGKLARNSEYQALLPLRGKILNVQKASPSEMLANAECASVIQVVGAGTGRTFDLGQMRYGKIVLMSVHPEESVLVTDSDGRLSLRAIGAYVDDRLGEDDHVPDAGTVSYDAASRRLRTSPLKRVIRHHYTGSMLTLQTTCGRSVRVTSGHSVFAWRDGRSVLVPSDQLAVGDRLVAPARLPRSPRPVVEVDLLALAQRTAAEGGEGFARFRPVDEDLCELLGWYVAVGSCAAGVVQLHLEPAYLPRLRGLVQRVFSSALTVRDGPGRQLTVSFRSGEAALLVHGLDLAACAGERRLPDLLLNVAESSQLAFLAGCYLGGGGPAAPGPQLDFPAGRAGADALGYLLGQLGVQASFRAPAAAGTGSGENGSGGPSWTVTVQGVDQVRRLSRVWRDAVSAQTTRAQLDTAPPGSGSGAERISAELVALPITRIEAADWDGPVYDFSVADDESFVAGFGAGVCAHNTDADVDGAHIRCLLITLFARYMRPVIDSGRLFAAVPPLHRVEIVGADQPAYTYSDRELTQLLKKVEAQGRRVKGGIQRYKGLGEMDPDQLAETTMHPASRTLRRINPGDAEAAERALELLMGNDVAPRRDFIVSSASRVNRELLDT